MASAAGIRRATASSSATACSAAETMLEMGALTTITPQVKDEMRRILAEIQDGSFAQEWVAEDDNGRP
ncbi:MAG: hypothetical protein LC644_09325, partial [Pseudonocardia sp.]|nr:hypothetical protein [Pseudonocardia sp.]